MPKDIQNKENKKRTFMFFDREPSIDPKTGNFIPGKRGILSALGRGMVGYSQGLKGIPQGPDPLQIENQRLQQQQINAPLNDFIERGKIAQAATLLGVPPQQIQKLGGQSAFYNLPQSRQAGIVPPQDLPQGKITETAINITTQPQIQPTIQTPNGQIVPKGFDKFGNPTGFEDVSTGLQKKQLETKVKWNEQGVDRQIKFDVLTPKLQNFMELGGRAYQELRDTADQFGINLDFRRGGLQAIKNAAFKNVAVAAKMAPLMQALDKLRPEIGTELMRQLGSFRSAEMAKEFSNTLANFSGDIRSDIADMTTTLVKNKANVVLLGDDGKPLPNDIKNKKLDSFEADLIRRYNNMYIGMGLMDKPYTAKRSFKWIAENSNFNDKEKAVIDKAVKDNKGFKREDIVAKLIEKGLL